MKDRVAAWLERDKALRSCENWKRLAHNAEVVREQTYGHALDARSKVDTLRDQLREATTRAVKAEKERDAATVSLNNWIQVARNTASQQWQDRAEAAEARCAELEQAHADLHMSQETAEMWMQRASRAEQEVSKWKATADASEACARKAEKTLTTTSNPCSGPDFQVAHGHTELAAQAAGRAVVALQEVKDNLAAVGRQIDHALKDTAHKVSPRRWTIYADHDCYGDGVTATEALALAHAERDAVRRRWPDVVVTVVVASGERPTTDDPEIEHWVNSVWQEILSTGGHGDYVPRVLARWEMAGREVMPAGYDENMDRR